VVIFTVYVAVVAGLAVVAEVVAPLLHEYTVPPLADKLVVLPKHIVEGIALAVTTGVAVTVITTESC